MRYNTLYPYDSVDSLISSVSWNFFPILFQTVLIFLVVFKINVVKKVWVKLIVDILLSCLIFLLTSWILVHLAGFYVELGGAGFNAILALSGVETAYFIERYTQTREREALAQKEIVEYQYEVLKAQINPHFLFNSLNILNSLIDQKSDASGDFIASLVGIYRYILSSTDKRLTTVEEELHFLNNYIEILKLRYGGIFNVRITSVKGTMSRRIIPYTLQLLIENVSKHNIITEECPMEVSIDILEDGIRVSNPIQRKRVLVSSRVGVKYMTKLYEARDRQFRIIDDGKTFTALVPYV